MEVQATPEFLIALLGVALSLCASYAPGFAPWFNKLGEAPDGSHDSGTLKRLVMLVLLLVIVGTVFALVCWGILSGVTCDRIGAVRLIYAYILALMANQTTHRVSPKVGYSSVKPWTG